MSAMKSSSMSTSVSKRLPLATSLSAEVAPDTENNEAEKRQGPDFASVASPDINPNTKNKIKATSIDATSDPESIYADAEATTEHVEDIDKEENAGGLSSNLSESALTPLAPDSAPAPVAMTATTTTTTTTAPAITATNAAEVPPSAEATRENDIS